MCNTLSHKNNMMPVKSATGFLFILVMKESPAPINAMPAIYVQNNAPGIHAGTNVFTKSVYKKWSMPKSKSINPKKYLPKNVVLYNAFIKPVFALPGKARATINAPPQSASSFKASVHAPNTFIMCVNLLG